MNKYRAWDKINKKMYQVYGWNTSTNEIYICSLPNSAFKDGALHTTHVITKPLDNFILMQSTGLKDENGVEIFEGDILRYNKNKGDKHEQGEVCEVVWRSDGCWSVGQLRFAQINSMEVIGNIHESPELLEEVE